MDYYEYFNIKKRKEYIEYMINKFENLIFNKNIK